MFTKRAIKYYVTIFFIIISGICYEKTGLDGFYHMVFTGCLLIIIYVLLDIDNDRKK